MKKLLTLTMVLIMALAMSVPAFAADVDQESDPKTGDMLATYTEAQTYTVTIPDTIDVAKQGDAAVAVTVSASDVVIDANQTLKVTVSSANTWKLVSEEGGEFNYGLYKGAETNALGNHAEVLSVAAGTATGSVALSAKLTEAVTKSGTFTDTLTFTVAVAVA